MNFGTQEQKDKFLPGVANGTIRFCLGITEPDGTIIHFPICLSSNEFKPAPMLQTSKPPPSERVIFTSSTGLKNGSQTEFGQTTLPLLSEQAAKEHPGYLS